MDKGITACPLAWPVGWTRSKRRRPGRYQVSFAKARDDLVRELCLMGVRERNIVISSNVPLRRDGFPYAGMSEPKDSGVAVYWEENREPQAMARDAWEKVRDNIRACGLAISGLRLIKRTEASEIINRAYTGFAALPPSTKTWRQVLGPIGPLTAEQIEKRWRALAYANHPDRGGRPEAMTEINVARDQALRELSDE